MNKNKDSWLFGILNIVLIMTAIPFAGIVIRKNGDSLLITALTIAVALLLILLIDLLIVRLRRK